MAHEVPSVRSTVQGVAAAVLVGINVVVDAVDVEGRVLDAVRARLGYGRKESDVVLSFSGGASLGPAGGQPAGS